jgi:hypothetical protein
VASRSLPAFWRHLLAQFSDELINPILDLLPFFRR